MCYSADMKCILIDHEHDETRTEGTVGIAPGTSFGYDENEYDVTISLDEGIEQL